jgi:hypothetical protein
MWHNSPYYNDSTNLFQGRVSYYGVTYDNVPMRFDQYRQHLVVLSPVSNYYCLPDRQHIDWFQMDGRTFTHDPYDPSRFAHLLCDGQKNGVRLYHCVWKVYGGEKLQQGKQLQKTFNTNEHYTLQTPDGKSHLVKGLSDVVRIFPEQKKRIKQFARKNHLSFSRQRREESLAKLVESLSPTPLTPTPNPSRGEGSLITPTINNATSNANQTPLPSGGAGGGCLGGGFSVLYGSVIKNGRVIEPHRFTNPHRMPFCHQSSLVRTSCLRELPFDINHRMSADLKFFKQLLLAGHQFQQVPFPIAIFDTTGVSNARRSAGLADNISVIREVDNWRDRLRLLPRLYFVYFMCRIKGK